MTDDTTGKTRADLILAAGTIPLLHGAQEADTDDQDDTRDPDDATQDGQADGDEGDDQHDGNDDDADEDDDDQVDVPELRTRLAEAEAEAARYKRRLLASDLRKKQVERELREARGTAKPKPKDGAPAEPDDRAATELAELRRQVQDANVRTMFADITKYAWQNPAAAYRLLDLTDVRQDDGTVDRDDLADAVDALAKDNPYLVKTAPPKPKAERPSGQQPGSGRGRDTTDKDALVKRFPALRGRY